MKRFTRLFLLTLTAMLAASCDLETSDNGDLDGFWQLTQMDTLSTGRSTDMRQAQIFLAVQVRMLEFQMIENRNASVFFRFSHQGDSLLISDPYFDIRNEHDPQVTDPEALEPYGLSGLEERFFVETLNSDRLTLRSERFRYWFRRY